MTFLRDVSIVANKAKGNAALRGGARVGYGVSGVLRLLIAWIAIQVLVCQQQDGRPVRSPTGPVR